MPAVLPTPDAGTVRRFAAGDENALVALYREEYDGLLTAAAGHLGHELRHFRGRVAHQAMLDAWHARERFRNPVALGAFLEEAVREEAEIQRRKHATLHHRDGPAKPHVTALPIDEAVLALVADLHTPVLDHEQAVEESRAMKRAHAGEHAQRVAGKSRWLPYGGLVIAVTVAIIALQRSLDEAGSERAIDRALDGDGVQHMTSGRGQRGALTLRDGTRATLGSETRLTVPDEFPRGMRTVRIEGTATFAVMPSTDVQATPFAVRIGTLTVAATGTTFTVRQYPEESAVVVQVTEGRVKMRDHVSHATHSLSAGEAVRFAAGVFTPLTGITRDVALAWTRDSLVFDRAPLRTVVPELVRWFGMNAVLIDSTAGERPVSLRLALTSSGAAAQALTEAAHLEITFGKGDRIEFRGAPEPGRRTR